MDEGRAVAKLSHPNIIKVFEWSTAPDETLFCVFEFLNGKNLAEALSSGRLIPREAARIAMEIACGLAAAHDAGIVHRDVKSNNVFLARSDSGQETTKILDFGISKFMNANSSQRATTGTALGTPEYMAPEQWGNSAAVDAKADVWSLGVVLYEMLAGQRPFRASNDAALRAMVQGDPPPPLDGIDPNLANLVFRCLTKEPARRPSIHEVHVELEPFAEASSIIVDASASIGPRTVSAAVEAASDGALIRVRKGIYRESITITKSIKILGDGVTRRGHTRG